MTKSEIKVLVVDDELLARKRICSLLSEHADINIVGECADGREAINAMHNLAPDLVFLDIQMPEINGLQVIGNLDNEKRPLFVLVTAYSEHGQAAFDADVIDYLLKPFDPERFDITVGRAKSRLEAARKEEEKNNLLDFINRLEREAQYVKQFSIRRDGRIFLIKAEDICWIEAERNYVRLYVGEMSYSRRESIGSLELQLDPDMFRRIHRSTIVNLNFIKELRTSPTGDYQVFLRNGENLVLSQKYQKNLREFFG
jgi:two-component system LytT family response regulator